MSGNTTIIRLAKQVECVTGSSKTKMLMYNKSDIKCAKMDNRPDCISNPDLCDPKKIDTLKKHKLKLAFAPCPKPSAHPDHAPPPSLATTIRICTYADLLQACPKPTVKPKNLEAPIQVRITWFAIKAAVAGCLVYLTYLIGIWSDGERSEDLFRRTKEFINPPSYPDEVKSSNCSEVERVGFQLRDSYNRTTVMILSTLANLPLNVNRILTKKHERKTVSMMTQTIGDSKFQNLPQHHGVDFFSLDEIEEE